MEYLLLRDFSEQLLVQLQLMEDIYGIYLAIYKYIFLYLAS